MTRRGRSKKVDASEAIGRLSKAKSFHQRARQIVDLTPEDSDASAACSLIAHAAIAYTDALTIRYLGEKNQDHGAMIKLLCEAVSVPAEQERRLRRIIDKKDDAEYGSRSQRRVEAEKLLADLDKFARWAEATMSHQPGG